MAGKIGKWLLAAREEERETNAIVRQALRSSLCRYDPYAPDVDELADKIEARMWQLAKVAPKRAGRFERWITRARGLLPKVGRHVKREALDFPQWREELKEWVSAGAAEIDFDATPVRCRSWPTDADMLADRFPAMFQLEVGASGRMTPFRSRLLDRLKAADERKASLTQAFGDPQARLTGVYGLGAAAVGLGIAEIADWSDPLLVACVGGAAGLATDSFNGVPTNGSLMRRSDLARRSGSGSTYGSA